jgi:hypothetical protein
MGPDPAIAAGAGCTSSSALQFQGNAMAAQCPRNRIVVFRLTDAEFNSLKSACAEHGGRNLSEFTRSELLSFLQGPPLERVVDSRFHEIQRQVEDLQRAMQQITGMLDRPAVPKCP